MSQPQHDAVPQMAAPGLRQPPTATTAGLWLDLPDKCPREPGTNSPRSPTPPPFLSGKGSWNDSPRRWNYRPPAEIKWDLMSPVTKTEIRDNLVGVFGCPGPDGLTWSELKKTPNDVLAKLFNLWIYRRGSPAQINGRLPNLPRGCGLSFAYSPLP